MFTYRSISINSSKKNVSYKYNSVVLIQIWMEQLRNKCIFIYFPYFISISLIGAVIEANLAVYYIDPPF